MYRNLALFVLALLICASIPSSLAQAELLFPLPEGQILSNSEVPDRILLVSRQTGIPPSQLQTWTDDQIIEKITENSLQPTQSVQPELPADLDWYTWGVQYLSDLSGISQEAIKEMSEEDLQFLIQETEAFLESAYASEAEHEPSQIQESVFLPMITGYGSGWSLPSFSQDFLNEFLRRLAAAKGVAEQLYPAHGDQYPELLCPSEAPGTPLTVRNMNTGENVTIGHNDGEVNFTVLSGEVIGHDHELQTVEFVHGLGEGASLTVWVDRFYFEDGRTKYSISIREAHFPGPVQQHMNLYFAHYLAAEDIATLALPYTVELYLPAGEFTEMARYTPRHGCEMSAFLSSQQGDLFRTNNSIQTISPWFARSIGVWGPQWNQIHKEPWDIFSHDAFADCTAGIDGTNSPVTLYRVNQAGMIRVPYESKVCSTSVSIYILAFEQDPLGLSMYALSALNLYGDPDISIPWPGPRPGDTTPRELIRHVEEHFWNGNGVRKLTGPVEISSTIRTFGPFGTMQVLLCYDYYDRESCEIVKRLVNVFLQIQVGFPPYDLYELETTDFGTLRRPYCAGCILSMYLPRAGLPIPGQGGALLELPEKSLVEQLLDDWLGMDKEVLGVIPTTMETQMATIEWMITFLSRAFPGEYPAPWIPSNHTLHIPAGTHWLAIPAYGTGTLRDIMSLEAVTQVCTLNGVLDCRPDLSIDPAEGYIVTADFDTIFRYHGTSVHEDADILCSASPEPAMCAFPVRPYPSVMVKASTISSHAVADGCENVTVSALDDSGNVLTYPGVDFQVFKGLSYRITSSNHCSFNLK